MDVPSSYPIGGRSLRWKRTKLAKEDEMPDAPTWSDDAVERRIRRNARDLHFHIREQTVEIAGLCPRCAEQHDGA